MNSKDAFKAVDDIQYTLAKSNPLYYLLFRLLRVEFVDRDRYVCKVCGKECNGYDECCGSGFYHGGITLDDIHGIRLYRNTDVRNILFWIKHELVHWMLRHTKRMPILVDILKTVGDENMAKVLANIVCDVKVNTMLLCDGERTKENVVSAKDIGLDEEMVLRASVEEIARALIGDGNKVKFVMTRVNMNQMDLKDGDGGGDEKDESMEIQGWSEDMQGKDREQLEEQIVKKIAEAVTKAEMISAGSNKGNVLLKVVKQSWKAKELEWYVRLFSSLNEEIEKMNVRDWSRENRRFKDYPGRRVITEAKVVCCIDVSGSVYPDSDDYKRFIGVVMRLTNVANVYVVFWDTRRSDVFRVAKEEDMRKIEKKELSFGGGTQITCLSDIFSKAKPMDILVVLTDGEWYDREVDVQAMLKRCRARKVLCWTRKEHKGFDLSIKVG